MRPSARIYILSRINDLLAKRNITVFFPTSYISQRLFLVSAKLLTGSWLDFVEQEVFRSLFWGEK